jgi:hypothetical protein
MEITGLTAEQSDMLDIIWSKNTRDDLVEFQMTLSPAKQQMCQLLIELIELEYIDMNMVGGYPDAHEIIERIRLL